MSAARIFSSFSLARRGFATATQGINGTKGSGVAMMKKGGEESKKSIPWVPDPVTGYYKPESHIKQVDGAELRELLQKQQKNQR